MKYPIPSNEKKRLQALLNYQILDTEAEQSFDDFTRLAAYICQTPIALISLIDEKRQWFKARLGLDVRETSRELAFCAHTIIQPEIMIVPDATKDDRFANNELVTESPHIRFYAGAPLITGAGETLGTLCVIDRKPNDLSAEQLSMLTILSRQVMAQLELRAALRSIKVLQGMLPICSYCKKIRNDKDFWEGLETYISNNSEAVFTHSICPPCSETELQKYAAYKTKLESAK